MLAAKMSKLVRWQIVVCLFADQQYFSATRGSLRDIWGLEPNGTHKTEGNLKFAHEYAYFANDALHDNSKTRWFEDDLQLSYKLSRLKLLPPGEILPRFAIAQTLPQEGLCKTNPSGLHKPWDTPWICPFKVMQLLAEPFARTQSIGR